MTSQGAVPSLKSITQIVFVYIGEYQRQEQQLLHNEGIRTIRVVNHASASANLAESLYGCHLLLRSNRLTREQYKGYWTSLASAGGTVITSPESFEIMNNFTLYYPAIRDWSPKALSAPAAVSDQELLTMIKQSGLVPPLFIRSDVESAAKYAGIQACMMQDIGLGSLSSTTTALRQHVKSFQEILVKEVFPIATKDDSRVEYRAIGAGGRLIVFDLKQSSPLSAPNKEIATVTEKALRSLAAYGADGAVFVDVALGTDDIARVVECKDFVNGTISNVKAFAGALLAWAGNASA